jgi:hypothetical protein
MARLVLLLLSVPLLTTPGWAQSQASGQPSNPWQVAPEPKPAPSFGLSSSLTDPRSQFDHGTQLIAGTELMPNGQVGVGTFGERADRPVDMRATARDFTIPRQPKTAVGFSLRF